MIRTESTPTSHLSAPARQWLIAGVGAALAIGLVVWLVARGPTAEVRAPSATNPEVCGREWEDRGDLPNGAIRAWICLPEDASPDLVPTSHPLEDGVDATVAAYEALPTTNRYDCLDIGGPRFAVVHEYPDGSLVPVTVDLGGCATARVGTDPDAEPRYEVRSYVDALAAAWQGQAPPDEPVTEAPCGEPYATVIPPRIDDLTAASICLAPGAPESLNLAAGEVDALAAVLAGEGSVEFPTDGPEPGPGFRPAWITLVDASGNTMTVRFVRGVLSVSGGVHPPLNHVVPEDLAARLTEVIAKLP